MNKDKENLSFLHISPAPPGQKPGGALQFSYVDAGIHPVDELVPVHYHALADLDRGEVLGVHQRVGVGPGYEPFDIQMECRL